MNLKNAFRNWKTNLHKHYNKYASDEDRLANPPPNLSSEDWELLLTYFQTEGFKAKSKRNKKNREKQVTKHTCGPRSFEEINFATRDPTTGQPAPPDQFWQITHTRKTADGQLVWADPQSEQIHTDLQELLQQQQEELESDARMTSDEILTAVLGERSGYVRGKGYGAEPLRKRGRFQSNDNSTVENVRTQLHEEFDKKFQEERAKMEANLAEERAKIEAERAKMEEERAQFQHRMEQMEQRIHAQLAILMQHGPVAAPTLSTPSLAGPQAGPSL